MTAGSDPRRPGRVRFPALAVAALILLVLAVLALAPAVSTSLAQQRRIEDAEARVARQRAELAGLSAERARWDDPAYVRAEAGRRLFYVLPGTTAYRVVHASDAEAAGPAPAATVRPDDARWMDVLLDSLIDAGTTTSTPAELESGR